MINLEQITGFEWDDGNQTKNWIAHQVSPSESEEVFFNQPLMLADDVAHSVSEKRYYVLGQSNQGRCLFVAFTIRNDRIRVISARDMSRKERQIYAEVAA
ncbi:MAG: BrnT family toxin [Anaerolineales bacterium]|nr:BrnT family toxin [Anaerolineales bacterium]